MKFNDILILVCDIDSDVVDPEDRVTAHMDNQSLNTTRDNIAKKYGWPQNGYSIMAYFTTHLVKVNFTLSLQD